ncbi:hypothetical protein WM04_03840 [Burkholderia ubonensis]|nr:hypothetical protein WM04_03840 [Burkholderia ubonensis]OJB20997.1 hypothetical protein BGV53_01505 [Burkholderia ubonensis]
MKMPDVDSSVVKRRAEIARDLRAIVTGTPAGIGMAREPRVWMKAGDVCEVEIEGLGVLRIPVAKPADVG